MKLPEDIRLKIEKNADKEDILLLLARLESDGVAITHDVYAAIVAIPAESTERHAVLDNLFRFSHINRQLVHI